MDFSFLKGQMRTQAVRKRSEIDVDYARQSAEKLIPLVQKMNLPAGSVVSAYWPMKTEMDLRPLMNFLHENNYTVCLPVVTEKNEPMLFRHWDPNEPLVIGMYGVEQPGENCQAVVPDVLFLPLLAFDRKGGRLGYGGGFYDRTIVRLRKSGKHLIVGVGFAAQEAENVPAEETDEKMDLILTETEIIEVA